MALYNANLIIRESRIAQGMTQERLAEGICSREAIVKLEKGERKPNWYIFREVLMRLGLDPEIYHPDEIISEQDMYLMQRWNKFLSLIISFKFDEAIAEVENIEAEKDSPSGKLWQSGLGYRLFLRIKASIYAYGANSTAGESYTHLNPALAIKYAIECLRLSRPDFEIDKIPEYYLATHEYHMLNVLCDAYILEDADKAIALWQKMKANIEKNYSMSISNATITRATNALYRGIRQSITAALYKAKRYEECLAAAEEGLAVTVRLWDLLHFANDLSLAGLALKELGRTEESKEYQKKAILLHYVLDGRAGIDFDVSKKYFEETFGGRLELFVPW